MRLELGNELPFLAAVDWTRAVEIVIWFGIVALSLALLILTWTRWGNSKTTHKCVALSVFAHLLLVIYAYETRLFLPAVGSPGDESLVPIQIVADDEPDSLNPTEDTPPTEIPATDVAESEAAQPELTAPELLPQPDETSSAAAAEEDREVALLIPYSHSTHEPADDSADDASSPNDATSSTQPNDTESVSESLDQPVETDTTESAVARLEAPSPIQDRADSNAAIDGPKVIRESPDRAALNDNLVPIDRDVTNASGPTPSNTSPTFRPSTKSEVTATPGLYSLRNPEQRKENALRRGGTEGSEQAVNLALEWLAKNQQPDGRWNPRLTEAGREFRVLGHDRQAAGRDADTAITGLALLSFLGAGHTHQRGDYQDQVRRGLQFISNSQSNSGHLAADASLFAHMYSHGIATLALGEAYALTGDQRLRPTLERAVAYTLAAQDTRSGGWRYRPGEEGDMSQFGWQVMALKSAQLGGIDSPRTAVQRMHRFLDSCTSGRYMGLASYRPRQAASPTMTAEALACRYFLGISVSSHSSAEATQFIAQQFPGQGEIDYYLWYYATLSLYQTGGAEWEQWNQQLQRQLIGTQVARGEQAGSWEPNGKWCGYGGRVFSTSLATMCLEVYYRYLPVVREQVAWDIDRRDSQRK